MMWYGVLFILKYIDIGCKSSSNCLWSKPPLDSLKFNVDGAVEGGFKIAGIDGVLCNTENVSLIMFSNSIGVIDVTSTELLALKEAYLLFRDSNQVNSFKHILETDCCSCVDWFTHPNSAPSMFKAIIEDCSNICNGFYWSIQHIPGKENVTEDKLAE
ncbi:hypothetical protein V6N11_061936 [Hibiscus sabdariffa]|uniref:RNase H type-1 domain-containing protein n=1 Tax=Hibiscus sabdariffa TaxID=183260 RepID=A0ABR2N7J7_9ROSI